MLELDRQLCDALKIEPDADGWWYFPWGGKMSCRDPQIGVRGVPDFSEDVWLAMKLATWLWETSPTPGRLFTLHLHDAPTGPWWMARLYPGEGDGDGDKPAEAISKAALAHIQA